MRLSYKQLDGFYPYYSGRDLAQALPVEDANRLTWVIRKHALPELMPKLVRVDPQNKRLRWYRSDAVRLYLQLSRRSTAKAILARVDEIEQAIGFSSPVDDIRKYPATKTVEVLPDEVAPAADTADKAHTDATSPELLAVKEPPAPASNPLALAVFNEQMKIFRETLETGLQPMAKALTEMQLQAEANAAAAEAARKEAQAAREQARQAEEQSRTAKQTAAESTLTSANLSARVIAAESKVTELIEHRNELSSMESLSVSDFCAIHGIADGHVRLPAKSGGDGASIPPEYRSWPNVSEMVNELQGLYFPRSIVRWCSNARPTAAFFNEWLAKKGFLTQIELTSAMQMSYFGNVQEPEGERQWAPAPKLGENGVHYFLCSRYPIKDDKGVVKRYTFHIRYGRTKIMEIVDQWIRDRELPRECPELARYVIYTCPSWFSTVRAQTYVLNQFRIRLDRFGKVAVDDSGWLRQTAKAAT